MLSTEEKDLLAERAQSARMRGEVYRTLSAVFQTEPTDDALKATIDAFVEADQDASSLSEADAALSAALVVLADSKDEDLGKKIRSEYAALFIGPRPPLAHPYESVYVGPQSRLFSDVTIEVRDYYATFGYKMPEDKAHRVPDDHISYELIFLAELCEREAGLLLAGKLHEAREVLSGQMGFLAGHLGKWVDEFAKRCSIAGGSGYYEAWAIYMAAFLHSDLDYLKEIADEQRLSDAGKMLHTSTINER